MALVYEKFVITVEFKLELTLELLEIDEFCIGFVKLVKLVKFVIFVLFVKFDEILTLLVFREEFE